MDYTDLDRVLGSMDGESHADDELIGQKITAASREIDRRVTGSIHGANYFELDDVDDEIGRCLVDAHGHLVYWARKAVVNSIASLAYRSSPQGSWVTVDPADVLIDGNQVTAWVNLLNLRNNRGLQIKLSYSGGFGATIDALPADLVEAATVLATRYYEEGKASLTDVVGVTDTGTAIYTKAMPTRTRQVIEQYRRSVPW